MVTTTRKRSRSAAIKPEAVSATISFLEGLPEKEKEDLSLREAIGQMQDTIKAALARGYTYDDVAKLLSDKGIKISALTLKNYAPSGKRQAAKSSPKRGRKPAAKTASTSEPTTEPAATPSKPQKATKTRSTTAKRGGQTKSAAKADTGSETTVKATRGRKSSTPKAATKKPTARKPKQPKA